MKVSELLETTGEYTVVEFASRKKRFAGTRKECIAWIQKYDEDHDKYVDMRVIDPSGNDDMDWETKPALQRKYKTD